MANLCVRFSKTAVSKYHRLGDLNNISLLSHSSGGKKFEIKISAGLAVRENLVQASLVEGHLLICLLITFPYTRSTSEYSLC